MTLTSDSPFISICMPVYRRAAFIRQALESCLKQNYSHFEILVHDDTEDDSLKSIIESYASEKIRYFHNKPPLGIVPKLNDFLEKSAAEWMLILCDDDYLEPHFLDTLSQHIKNYPNASLIRSRYRLVDGDGNELRLDRLGSFSSTPYEFLRDIFLSEKRNFKMNISGILFRRRQLQSQGGFKNLYRGWHVDRLAWAELGALGETICDPTPLCSVRLHDDSLTSYTEPYYKKAIASDLLMKNIISQLFDRLESKQIADADQALLEQARLNFHAYINRHLSKSMDQGFIAALENKTSRAELEVSEIFQTMKTLRLPVFNSARAYRLIAPLPYGLRIKILHLVQKYKKSRAIS